MPCVSPLKGWRSKSAGKSGRRSIVFNPSHGFRDLPVEIPCGQCIGCRLERSRQWAVRLMHELHNHEDSCFVTLTYSDENLPSDMSLDKRHLQLFFKRLRKRYGALRYFAVGEYGDETKRPHYHAIIFGWCPDDAFPISSGAHPIYYSPSLEQVWGLGICSFGKVTFESAAYVARYCTKKITGPIAESAYQSLDVNTGEIGKVLPEFALMSKKPALGIQFYQEFKDEIFPCDYVISRGHKAAVPRVYFKALEKETPRAAEEVRKARSIAFGRVREQYDDGRLVTIGEYLKKSMLARNGQ